VTTDDLSTPLGQKPARKRWFRLPFSAMQALAVVLGLLLLGFIGVALFVDNPLGGEPIARVAINQPNKVDDKPSEAKAPVVKAAEPAAPANSRTITIIDGSSGQRRDVVVSGDSSDPVDPAAATSAAPMAGVDARLLEKSRYGMVPIAANGVKPFNAYSETTDALRARAAKMPVISIVVGGLGVGAAKTNDAIMKLPAAVTLAFTPYGMEPGKLVERARAQHHEVLLQIPMEPFEYPDNDPGPQTLLTSLTPEANADRLAWHMSRIQGYVGIANFMGAKFIATDAAMQPIIKDAAKRGLGFLDDNATPRSVAGPIAEGQAMPFARADFSIDVVPTSIEIDRALARLETQARERGTAIGTASALPISIERIGAWAKQLESRGILLVPLTTTMLKSKSS
jgi:polysaccharide deacetylase 2 family uncharacterized protein YibQ